MKIIITKSFTKFIKNNMNIINSFLFTSLLFSSLVVGFVPQIPLWVLLLTIPISLISMIVFYIKSYSYIHQNWISCKKHNLDFVFSYKKYLKYIYLGVLLLIPLFNLVVILLIIKHEKKVQDQQNITCKKDHLEIRSGIVKTRTKEYSKDRIKEFNNEF